MSKCDVRVGLHRSGREFVGDEPVEGVVVIRANEAIAAKKIILKCFWETHGRGNRDSAPNHSGILEQDIQLRSGEERSFPFRLRAPHGPPTYHGTHLNVDHYVEAEVDLAWSKNPKGRQDFLLRAGPQYEGPPSPAPSPMQLPGGVQVPPAVKAWKGGTANLVGCVLGIMVLAFVLLFFFAFWPLAIIGGAVGAFFFIRHRMVRSRVGEVTFSVRPTRITAGDECTIRLAFRPEKASPLNKLAVTLIAQEVCTSGSGTNKKTRTFQVVSEEHELRGAGALMANEEIDIERVVTVPERGAYSFEASHNKLRWIAEARIDIPGWPDWSGKEALVVLPPLAGVSSTEVETRREAAEIEPPVASRLERDPVPGSPSSAGPREASGDLEGLLAAIQATDRYSDQRDRLLAASVGMRCTLEVRTHATEWTSSFDDDGYRDGRSIVGTLAGTSIEVHARFHKGLNSSIDALSRGDVVRIDAAFKGWDRLLDRAEFDVVVLQGRVGD